MSNFTRTAIHPITKKPEDAYFMDNYFGRHKYGVAFPCDGSNSKVYRDYEVEEYKEGDRN